MSDESDSENDGEVMPSGKRGATVMYLVGRRFYKDAWYGDSEDDGEVTLDRAQRHKGTAVIYLVTLEPILRHTHTIFISSKKHI